MANEPEFLPLIQASRQLGISRPKLGQLIADGLVQTFADPVDKRRVLVRPSEVTALRQNPQPRGLRSAAGRSTVPQVAA
jgi:hypothetical protein